MLQLKCRKCRSENFQANRKRDHIRCSGCGQRYTFVHGTHWKVVRGTHWKEIQLTRKAAVREHIEVKKIPKKKEAAANA